MRERSRAIFIVMIKIYTYLENPLEFKKQAESKYEQESGERGSGCDFNVKRIKNKVSHLSQN